ncbi:M48 family metalloprotease [Polaromonas sp. CT11-55]|uniref:M48 family metalloprotease n=1 Tax=Polaromonas sp. CT11-55 TaxID=3243045 RepID=UPI0039A740A8
MKISQHILGCLLMLSAPVAFPADLKPSAEALEAEARLQREFAVKSFYRDFNRIEQVVYPLLRVGAPYCSTRQRWAVGPSPRTEFQLSEEFRPHAASVGLDAGLSFVSVLEGTPAAAAGVRPGDKVLAVNAEKVPTGNESVAWFERRVHELRSRREPILLGLQRDGAALDITVGAHQVCNIGLRYVPSDAVNAAASTRELIVTAGMLRFAPDDQDLALVLGHEVAHTALRHPEELTNEARARAAGGILGVILGRAVFLPARDPYGQDKERDADYLGIYLAAAAGYEVSAAPDFWRRMAAKQPSSIKESFTASHPSAPERYLRLQAAVAEIAEKQKQGKPLLPNLAELKTAYDGDYVSFEAGKQKTVKVLKPSIAEGATLPDFTQVPFVNDDGRVAYQRFLTITTRPRAFAIHESGLWSLRMGVNAAADALASCNSRGRKRPCQLYVVNDELVWKPGATGKRQEAAAESTADATRVGTSRSRAEPEGTAFARLDDVDAVPGVSAACRDRYKTWLAQKAPRAYAVGPAGHCGFSWGPAPPDSGLSPDPSVRALAACARTGKGDCKLYAVDGTVVWKP